MLYIIILNLYLGTYVCVILPDKKGKLMAAIRSNDIVVKVLTDADTDTPCKQDTVLQKNIPKIHAIEKETLYHKIQK